ncbi:MAG: DUF1576 domain-containing protein [Christensenellales bacterium]|jgi:hypothetical protein
MRQWLDRLRALAQVELKGNLSISQQEKSMENLKYFIVTGLSLLVLLSSFLFNSPQAIWEGLGRIAISPSTLLSDYLAIGVPGAAIMNSGIMMLICLVIARKQKAGLNGSLLASIIMVGGFALFGKNPLNTFPIILGVLMYAKIRREPFTNYILSAFFGFALGPLISHIAFGLSWPLYCSIPLALAAGLLTGIVLPVLARHFTAFHQGYCLYNIGFTCGVWGTVMMALLRMFGLGNEQAVHFPLTGYETPLLIWVLSLIALMALIGWLLSPALKETLMKILREPGRLSGDFVSRFGIGPVLFNMALLGLMATGYVFLSGGRLNGPTLGAILSAMSFGGFGKHPRNVWPILLGAQIMAQLGIHSAASDAIVIAALFGTNLAPIPGSFGWPSGILAGFIHVAVSSNLSYLHGYANLYNNGFAGGILAGALAPLLIAISQKDKKSVSLE